MVEVFKTDVKSEDQANHLIDRIHSLLEYHANFDLEDCDKILRVECKSKSIEVTRLIDLLKGSGIKAEIL